MRCRVMDMRSKEVININDGSRLGYVSDMEFDSVSGQVCSVVIPGPCRFFGLFGRTEDYVIAWEKITRIGDDIVLVDASLPKRSVKRKPWL